MDLDRAPARPAGLRLHLRLSLLPRHDLEPLLTRLAAAGLVPQQLEVPGADGAMRVIPLGAATAPLRRLPVIAGAVCAILALVAIIQPLLRQSLALSRSDLTIAELKPRVDQVQALRRRIAGQTAGQDVIAAERGRIGDVLTVLATITDILPDDAHLTSFKMAGRRITLEGQAAGAARLITSLSADPGLRDPTFAAPVTHDARAQADLFVIRADVGF